MKKVINPPRIGQWLLKKIIPDNEEKYLIEGIQESFGAKLRTKGRLYASVWYWKDILFTIPHILKDNIMKSSVMFASYLKIAFRTLKRQKINTAVNITGLSIAISLCVLVLLLADHEFSYDNFHSDSGRIYSIVSTNHYFGASARGLCYPAAPAMQNNFPEIEDFVRVRSSMRGLMEYDGKVFEEYYTLVDEQFFQFFSFPLVSGNQETVLKSDNSVVLTVSMAEKYFGSEDPIGKTVTIEFRAIYKDFIVTGIAEDPPVNSSIRFNILFNIANMVPYYSRVGFTDRLWAVDWSNLSFFKLRNDVDPVSIETKFDSFLNENYNRAAPDRVSDRRGAGHARSDGNMWSFGLQNISEVHFSPDIRGLYDMNDIENIWLLGGIALLILFIALINYLNLFIGSSSVRAVEIGLRKVMGADKKRMVYQFNVESIMITVFAFIMGLIIVLFALPVFNQLLDKELDIRNLLIFSNVVYAFLFIMIVAFISGSFSAFIIPKFKPVDILKGKLKLGNRNIFTKTLVIAQFGLSIILLISTLVMGNQIRFLRNRDMGFDKGGLLLIRTFENDAAESKTIAALAQDRMSNNSGIKSVTASLSSFNRYRTSTAPHYVNGRRVNINFNNVYYDYLSTMGVNLIEGRDFSREFSNDTTAIIVNEKFVELLDIDDPIGKSIRINMTGNPELRIIGILEDYHFASLEEEIYPSMLCLNRKTATFNNLLLRISTENITNTIDYLENTWKEIQPDKPFEYSFVDDDIEASFYNLKKWNKIVNITSVLALIVTCIGIFCLTSFIMTRKIKEIGIRKVLGSSVPQILSLIGREFIPFVLIANLIAMPVAWMMMEEWLKDFPYRISIGIDIFIISAVLSITCTVLTVSYHSIRSALTNPVDSLRYE